MGNTKITINGKEETVEGGISITKLLKAKEVKMPDMVSVEYNGKILKKEEFANTLIKEGDKVEFLYFMGGGRF